MSAPNIIVKGKEYSDITSVDFKTPGSGTVPGETYYWTGDANATPSTVLDGVVFYTAEGKTTGTYVPSGSVTYTVTNATDGDVLSGKSFYKATSTTTATLIVGSYTPPTGGFNIDLTGTTWVINANSITYGTSIGTFSINYTSDGYTTYNLLDLFGTSNYDIYYNDTDDKYSSHVYGPSSGAPNWIGTEGQKTISITGGSDASDPALVAWLLTNATKQ